MKKFLKVVKWLLIILVVAASCFAIGFKIYTGSFYKADEATINVILNECEDSVNAYQDDKGMVFIPEGQDIRAVVVFYPGGKVEYTAYQGLMYELASRGILCLLPRMPENLAFLRLNAVEMIQKGYESETALVSDVDWYLAGHSLGGVAAADYLANYSGSSNEDGGATESDERYAGLILCASYTTSDYSNMGYRVLSIYGDNDGVLNMDNYEANKKNWPSDATEYVIKGGIHSFFGCYGIQKKDGVPSISNYDQIKETAQVISDWIG